MIVGADPDGYPIGSWDLYVRGDRPADDVPVVDLDWAVVRWWIAHLDATPSVDTDRAVLAAGGRLPYAMAMADHDALNRLDGVPQVWANDEWLHRVHRGTCRLLVEHGEAREACPPWLGEGDRVIVRHHRDRRTPAGVRIVNHPAPWRDAVYLVVQERPELARVRLRWPD